MTAQMGLFDGVERAREGIQQVLSTEQHWLERTMRRVYGHLLTHGEFSSDDLYDLLPWPPHHPNAIGALMRTARTSGYLTGPVGHIHSRRPAAHSRRIPVYQSKLYRKGY